MKSFDLRNKLISKVKTVQEQELERQKNRVQKCKAGSILGSALDHSKQRSPSVNSISSDDSILSDKNPTKKKKRKKNSDSSDERETTVKGEDSNSEIFITIQNSANFMNFILYLCCRGTSWTDGTERGKLSGVQPRHWPMAEYGHGNVSISGSVLPTASAHGTSRILSKRCHAISIPWQQLSRPFSSCQGSRWLPESRKLQFA